MKSLAFSKIKSLFRATIRVYGQNTREVSVLRSKSYSVWEASASVSAMQKNLAHQEETEGAQANQKIGGIDRTSVSLRAYLDWIQREAADWHTSFSIQKDASVVSQAPIQLRYSTRSSHPDCRRLVVSPQRSALGALSARAQTSERYGCLLHGSDTLAGAGTFGTLAYGGRRYPWRYQKTNNRYGFRRFSEFQAYCRFARMDSSALSFSSYRPIASQSREMEVAWTRRQPVAGIYLSRCANGTHRTQPSKIASDRQTTPDNQQYANVPPQARDDRARISPHYRFFSFLLAISATQLADDNQCRRIYEQFVAEESAHAANASFAAFVGNSYDSHN